MALELNNQEVEVLKYTIETTITANRARNIRIGVLEDLLEKAELYLQKKEGN